MGGDVLELFRVVKVMLLGTIILSTFKLFSTAFMWSVASEVAGYLGAFLLCIAMLLAVIGWMQERSRPSKGRTHARKQH